MLIFSYIILKYFILELSIIEINILLKENNLLNKIINNYYKKVTYLITKLISYNNV